MTTKDQNLECYESNLEYSEEASILERMRSLWIPVSERLPDSPGEYLIVDEGIVTSNFYYVGVGWIISTSSVTHWMPLPLPPNP